MHPLVKNDLLNGTNPQKRLLSWINHWLHCQIEVTHSFIYCLFPLWWEDNYCHLLIIPGPVFSNVCHMWAWSYKCPICLWDAQVLVLYKPKKSENAWKKEKKEVCWSLIGPHFLVFGKRESNDGNSNPKGHFFRCHVPSASSKVCVWEKEPG